MFLGVYVWSTPRQLSAHLGPTDGVTLELNPN